MRVQILVTVEDRHGSHVVEVEHLARRPGDVFAVGDQLLLDHPDLGDLGPATVTLRRWTFGPLMMVQVYATIPYRPAADEDVATKRKAKR